jgi:hypothetical protein
MASCTITRAICGGRLLSSLVSGRKNGRRERDCIGLVLAATQEWHQARIRVRGGRWRIPIRNANTARVTARRPSSLPDDLVEGLIREFGVRRRRTTAVVLWAVGLLTLIFLYWGIFVFDGLAFRMILKPSDGHATVQFLNPECGTHTPEFPVDLAVDRIRSVDLTGRDIDIPGVTVHSHDVTLLPGILEMRVGWERRVRSQSAGLYS